MIERERETERLNDTVTTTLPHLSPTVVPPFWSLGLQPVSPVPSAFPIHEGEGHGGGDGVRGPTHGNGQPGAQRAVRRTERKWLYEPRSSNQVISLTN